MASKGSQSSKRGSSSMDDGNRRGALSKGGKGAQSAGSRSGGSQSASTHSGSSGRKNGSTTDR